MFPEPSAAPIIALRSVVHVMTYSINLDREMRVGAVEIEHVRTDRMLPNETLAFPARAYASGSITVLLAATECGGGAGLCR
jgi:hypothetical protein